MADRVVRVRSFFGLDNMFGIAVPRTDQLTQEERDRYNAIYCGVCFGLKRRHGQLSRISLSFDATFLALFLGSLHESQEQMGSSRCISHPTKKVDFIHSENTDYAADVSILLAYMKFADDIQDDRSLKGRFGREVLKGAHSKVREEHPNLAALLDEKSKELQLVERSSDAAPDDAAGIFAEMLEEVFAQRAGIWEGLARSFSNSLGRFIYLMDAAIDIDDDLRKGSYNPFANVPMGKEQIEGVLCSQIADACEIYERIPLIKDKRIMDSVLYSGVWQKYNRQAEEAAKKNGDLS